MADKQTPNPSAEEPKEETVQAEVEAVTETAEGESKTGESKEEKPAPAEQFAEDIALDELDPTLKVDKIVERGGEKFIKMSDLTDNTYSRDKYTDLEKLYEQSLTDVKEGEIVSGKIIAISEKEVSVDIGFKSEGVVDIEEFNDPSSLKVGDEIDVFLDSVEDSEGMLQLSKRKADFMRVWDRVKNVYAADGIIRGRCVRRIKGGMVVDLGGVDAFLPGSQIDVRPVRDFDAIIGTEMEFKILKINDLRKNIVVSHKVLKEEELREVREKLLSNLDVGMELEGTVKNITDFGVFVDLGGVDGLLHITDLSWGRVSHPSEVVQLDQKIRVKVLNYDKERKRISLGLKQLYEHLWTEIDKKYRVGQKIQGRVVSLAKYGAFIEIEPGIEGLVHISEMSWTQHIKHPNQVVHENEFVQVVVLNIDKENKKISLGLKQVEQDPWENFEAKYRVDTRHKGIVRDLVPFGAFVELADGIDGLVHISDLSWTKKVRHPGEILKKGDEVAVVVLSFDRDERRIALGIKQTEGNPWEDFEREMPVGTRTTGTASRLIDKGVIIELPHGIEGFLPNSQISRKYFDGKKRTLQVGDVLNIIVVEFDKEEHKVILSNSQAEKKEESAASAPYSDNKGSGKTATLADTLPEDSPLLKAMKKAEVEEAKEKKAKTSKKKVKEEKPKAEKAETKKTPKAEAKDESEAETPVKPKAKKKEDTKEETPAEAELKPKPKTEKKADEESSGDKE
ncbi:MAG: 30S ribosomal protein S1 [bacterium]